MAELRVKSTGTLKLFESDNTSSVTIASPASLGGDRTITLPDASVTLASGTMLATDGDGSGLSGVGKVLQVVSATQTGKESITGDTDWQDAANLSLNITCAATSSKVLVLVNVSLSCNARYGVWRILRDATAISVGVKASLEDEVSGASMTNFPSDSNDQFINYSNMVNYLDSPSSTSELTYKIQVRNSDSDSAIQYVNVPSSNATAAYVARTASTITAIEIGA
jgi:ABC-type dipeptide/oligopeptide/nickel transport system ATPase subunit